MKRVIFIVMMLVILTSCESKSRQRSRVTAEPVVSSIQPEKVVVLSSSMNKVSIDGTYTYYYKVKRIEKGVVDYARDPGVFEVGDTILVQQMQFK